MKNNFLSKVTKMPQNTGGGNLQTKRATLALPLRYLCAMLLALFMGVGNMWGANGDVLFTQDFNSATAVSQNLGAAAVDIDKESGNNIFGVTYTNSQFTSLKAAKISNAKGGIAINSKVTSNSVEYDYAKKFGFRSDDTKASFHLVKTTNFASSAPTALKVEMNMYYKQLSSGSNVTASFAIGDGFSDKEKPANSNIHSGFTIKGNGTATFCQFGTTTNLTGYSTAMTQDEDVKMTWVINHSGGVLKYTDPKGDESSLANNAFDVWIGTTKNVSGAPATTGTKALQNLYIGDCDAKKKFEFYLDDIKVTDLTPCAAPSITTQPIGASLAIGDANPTLSVTANNTTSYTWKESSDGTSHDGSSSLGTSKDFTPSVNTAAQTKYYYCELVNSCNTSNVVKTNIVTVNVVASVVNVTGVSLDKTSQEFTLGATTTTTLTATVAPNDATNKAVSWESSAPTKVSVTDNGDGTAAIEGLAEGTATITVTTQDGSFAATCDVTVNPDPCHKYFWFSKAADATTAGVTNNEGSFFTTSASGSNSASSSITIDEVEYAITNRTSNIGNSDATIVSFTIPADKAGTFYTNMSSSGNSGAASSRTLYLKKGGVTVVTATDAIYGDGAQHNATIENIPSGTYTLHANNNVKVGMFAVKACDATYHTITLDLNGGTGATSIAALDGVPAYKPADPTKENNTFSKWVVKSTSADYNWSSNVTGDIELKAIWTPYPTLTLDAGEGSGTEVATQYAPNTEITAPAKPDGFSYTGYSFTGWKDGSDNDYSVGDPLTITADITLTAQWALNGSFNVKFYQGYGEPDVQIGETQSISTGNFAVAPADPVRDGYRFLGWSTDGTEANIVTVASYVISVATDFTAVWIQQFEVTFDGAGAVSVDNGATVASPDSPTQAGKVFQGWYNGESKYDFSAAVTGNLALESKWAVADPNHFYYTYNDDFHFDGVVYKTPEGKTTDPEADEATLDLTSPYTLFSGAEGITSIVATKAVYDYKKADNTKHITAYLKLKKSSDDANSKLIFTIASGYTAVLKVKMGGYSKTPTVTLKKGDDAVTGTPAAVSGKAEDKDYAEITYNLVAGVYEMTTADQTLYFSHIDLQATALPTHTVTYKAGDGTGADVVDADATEVRDGSTMFTAPTGQVFNGWKNESDASDVAVGAIVEDDMNLIAQWINVYAVTFNMNGHGDAIDPQDIKEGAKATRPDDPIAIGFDFGGWFTDEECTAGNEFDFNTSITAATPLYAKWTADPCSDKKSVVKVVMTAYNDAAVTGYNNNEYAGGKIINNLSNSSDNKNTYDFGEGEVTGYKLASSKSAIMATLAKGNFEYGDKIVVAVTNPASAQKLRIYAASDVDNVLLVKEIDAATAGIYEYKFTAAEIEAINDAGYKSIGVFRGDYNPFIYSVELKGCRSWAIMHTLTFKNIDGTATIAAESLEESAYASTVAPAAPKIATKRFLGWAEAVDGTPVDLTTYTIAEDKTLYAVYEDIVCPTTGTVYKFEIKDELPSENLPTITDKDMSSYITATGDGYLTYTATANNKATINSDGTIQMKDASAAYLKVELECALAAGDQIRAHVTNNPIRVQVGTTYDSNKDLILAKNAYEFVAITSAMEGKQVLYITRSSNGNANLADFEIYRPAKYDVSFNMMGHGSAIADLEDVVEGSKIAAPSPAPTDADYSFAGWYKENTLENEWKFDVDVVETNTTLYAKWLDKSDATLKSLMYGETEIALEAGEYTYNVSLPAFTSAVPALTAETSNPSATKVIANAAAFDSEGNATSTVTVTPEVGADQVYTVNFAKGVEILLQDVTGSITWNFANAVTGTVNITGTPQVLANYGGVTNDNTFESDKLEASGEKFSAGTKANLRANYIHFRTTVPGILSISYSNTGGNPARYIYVNGAKYDEDGSANTTPKGADNKVFVPAGDVELVMKDGEDESKNVQIYQMIFNATPNYTRPVTEGRYGTICLPNGGVMVGAELYEVAYKDPSLNKIFFDQVVNGEMIAGRPYIFLPKKGASQLAVFYTDATDAPADNYHGLYGSYTEEPIADGVGNYILSNNQYREVAAGGVAYVTPNRAYFKYDEIPGTAYTPLPGRKRMSIGAAAPAVTTGMDELNASEAPAKMLINGQLFILRGEKMYDAKGQLVK